MNYKEMIRNYIEKIPDDSITKALYLCKEYIDKVMDTAIWELNKANCTDSESRSIWRTEMEYRDKARSKTHNALIQAMLAVNASAKRSGLEPLFPMDADTPRQIVGDIAGEVVHDIFTNRKT